MTSPRVAVVVPCYNLGRYLEETLASVMAQTFEDFEVVVVDDGSNDPATRELLEGLTYPRTRVVRTPNRGLAAARNRGARETTAPFLTFLDADDLLRPAMIEKTLGAIEGPDEPAFVSFWLQNFGDLDVVWSPTACDVVQLLAECTVCTAALVRRSAFDRVGGFDESMPEMGYEDWEFWLRLVAQGGEGVILPEVLFDYRRRTGSMSDRCCSEEGHEILMGYMIQKHRPVFERHLGQVLELKAAELEAIEAQNLLLESRLDDLLDPGNRLLALEAARLERKVEEARSHSGTRRRVAAAAAEDSFRYDLEARLASLEESLARVASERDALRGSWSWRITRPLRRILGWFLKRRSPASEVATHVEHRRQGAREPAAR